MGIICPTLVEIGLTDLPKSGGATPGLLLAVQGQKLHHVGDAHSGLERDRQIRAQILFYFFEVATSHYLDAFRRPYGLYEALTTRKWKPYAYLFLMIMQVPGGCF